MQRLRANIASLKIKRNATPNGWARLILSRRDTAKMERLNNTFDYIIDTVSAGHNLDFYLGLLRTNGVMICVGLPSGEEQLSPFNLVLGRSIAGSLIGGLPETQDVELLRKERNHVRRGGHSHATGQSGV